MKQTLQNRSPRRWLLLAFVLNFAIAAAALLPYMIRDGGLLLVAADFDAEQLSYNMLCNNAIKSGEVLWNWRIDIGSDFVSSFSFYTLGSPFFWLSFLFPASAFPYLVGWIYMLKYAVAGLTSFAYFRRSASEKSALLGSVLYAFSREAYPSTCRLRQRRHSGSLSGHASDNISCTVQIFGQVGDDRLIVLH